MTDNIIDLQKLIIEELQTLNAKLTQVHKSLLERREVVESSLPEIMDPIDIQDYLGIGQKQTYELLNQDPKPFNYVKVGRRFKIPRQSFLKWLSEKEASDD
jgi:hypothetical protein